MDRQKKRKEGNERDEGRAQGQGAVQTKRLERRAATEGWRNRARPVRGAFRYKGGTIEGGRQQNVKDNRRGKKKGTWRPWIRRDGDEVRKRNNGKERAKEFKKDARRRNGKTWHGFNIRREN